MIYPSTFMDEDNIKLKINVKNVKNRQKRKGKCSRSQNALSDETTRQHISRNGFRALAIWHRHGYDKTIKTIARRDCP